MMKKGLLILENGVCFSGVSIGAKGGHAGEVVFNTGLTGYQEILTDPSYYGQIVTMTYPLIGNYGINKSDFESRKPWIRGFIVKENCTNPSHWEAERTLTDYLVENNIPGLAGIDTRALTKILRTKGTMRGLITSVESDPDQTQIDEWVKQASAFNCHDHVASVTNPEIIKIDGEKHHVVVIDYGVKENIIRSLVRRGCKVTSVPFNTTKDEIIKLNPDGIVLSNGPGDPDDIPEQVEIIRQLIEWGGSPMFGICLGHQILSLAIGGKSYKLKYGHRGANHPVLDLKTRRVFITSQNHGYAIEQDSLPDSVEVSQINLNDDTVEGIEFKDRPIFSVQYHPEASPGPMDNQYLFDRFLRSLENPQKELHVV